MLAVGLIGKARRQMEEKPGLNIHLVRELQIPRYAFSILKPVMYQIMVLVQRRLMAALRGLASQTCKIFFATTLLSGIRVVCM